MLAGVGRCAAVLAVLLTSLAPVSVSAHNGVGASYKAKVGRYLVYVYDGYAAEAGAVEYRMVVLEAKSQNPYYDVRPQVRASRNGKTARADLHSFGNIFYFSLPNPYPERWQVQVDLTGGLGRASTSFRVHGVDPVTVEDSGTVVATGDDGGGANPLLIGGIVLAAVVVAGVAVLRRRGPDSRHR